MEEVAVCIVTNDAYYQTRYCIENLIAKTNVKVRLHIVDCGSEDQRLIDWLKVVCDENKWYFKQTSKIPLANAYNILLQTVYQKHCCLFPANLLVNTNWLEDLYTSASNYENAGIMSIRRGDEKVFTMPLLYKSVTEDDFLQNVWFTENNSVEGVYFFDKSVIEKTGLFDENLNLNGFEKQEFCFRASANGYRNFYVRNQTCVQTTIKNEILFPTKTKENVIKFKGAIEIMVKANQFKK